MANCGYNAGGVKNWVLILLIVMLMQNSYHVTRTVIAIEMKRISYPMGFNLSRNQPPPHTMGTAKFAVYQYQDQQMHGVAARLSIWKPEALNDESSMTFIGVSSGHDDLNSIVAGWMVHPPYHKEPRYFIFWTKDNFRTGCFNLLCPGFHKTNTDFDFDKDIDQVSTYSGVQHYVNIAIYQQQGTRSWSLRIDGSVIGYWLNSSFTSLAMGGDSVEWSGQVSDLHKIPHATTTQMGSGHFPKEGSKKAGSFDHIRYVDSSYKPMKPKVHKLKSYVSHPGCYNLSKVLVTHGIGVTFYYGGPGYSPTCLQ